MAKKVDLQERLNMRFLTVAYADKQEIYGTNRVSADTGSIALDILNIPDPVLEELIELTDPMMELVDFLNNNRNPNNKVLSMMLTASKNVFRAVDLEVDISGEVVGQETHTDFQSNEFAGEWEQFFFTRIEEVSGSGEESAQESFKHFKTHTDFGKIQLIFRGRAGSGAHHIAEVIVGQTGHHGIQVDHADTLTGNIIDKHVIEFGIVVSGAFKDISGGKFIEQERVFRFPCHDEIQFRGDIFHVIL